MQLQSRTTDGKTNVGKLTIDNIQYNLPHAVSKLAGSYNITATPLDGYVFDHWELSGGITAWSTTSQSTTLTISSDGTLTAVFKPSPITYILNVKSSPMSSVLISYTGDYVGIERTDFEIGPKTSSFTVTLTAPSTHEGYKFSYWQLGEANMGKNRSLTVKVDDNKRELTATAIYIEKETAYDSGRVARTVIAGVAFDILGSAIIGRMGLNLPRLITGSASAFFIPSIAGTLASGIIDLALRDVIKDYDQRFIVSSSFGIGVSLFVALGLGAAFPPLGLGYLAGVAITVGIGTVASYFLGKLG